MSLLSYLEFVEDCNIEDDRSKFCRRQDAEIVFTVTNLEEDPSSAAGEANADRALCRFELLEAVVRLAISKYLKVGCGQCRLCRAGQHLTGSASSCVCGCDAQKQKGGHTTDVSDSVAMLCEQNIRPYLEPMQDQFDSDVFRKNRLYSCVHAPVVHPWSLHLSPASDVPICDSEDVNRAFLPHMPILRALHKKYCKFKSKVQQLKTARMSLSEWIKMLSDANMFNDVRIA